MQLTAEQNAKIKDILLAQKRATHAIVKTHREKVIQTVINVDEAEIDQIRKIIIARK